MSLAWRKALSLAITVIYSTTQVAFGAVAESNFWAERRRQVSKQNADENPVQFASLPASMPNFPQSLSKQLPAVSAVLPNLPKWNDSKASVLSPSLQSVVDSIPSTVGSIQEVYDSGIRIAPPVVLIQDVHLNPEAQQNIASLLQELIERKKIGLIGVEGAFTSFDFKPFRSISERKVTQEVVDAFLKKGLLAAPSYVGIVSPVDPPPFIGIDNREHYDANVTAYLATRDNKESAVRELGGIQQDLIETKRKTFSKELLAFDDLRVAYHSGQLGIGSYIKRLSGYPIDLDFTTEQFLKAYELEQTLDFKQVENQRRAVIEKLTKTLSEVELQQLLSQSLAYQLGQLNFGGYYRHLKNLCAVKGISLSQVPAFDRYIQYVLLSDGIKAEKLFSAVKKSEERILRRLVKTPEEAKISALSEKFYLSKKLIEFELTPTEWERYKSNDSHLANLPLTAFENFYCEADIRSRLMIEKLSSHPKNGNRAMVIGGFHTREISNLLRSQKISFIVVSPKITKIDDGGGSSYLSVFAQEKTPLDQLFAGQKLFLGPETANITSLPFRFRLLACIAARVQGAANVVISIGQRAIKVHVEVLNKADATEDDVRLSWGERVYLAVGANWEVVFQLFIPLALWLFPTTPGVGTAVWIISSFIFALAHPRRTPGRLIALTAVGLLLGAPFLFGSFMTDYGIVDSIILHSGYNILKLLGLLPHWTPYASILSEDDLHILFREDEEAERWIRAAFGVKGRPLTNDDIKAWAQKITVAAVDHVISPNYPIPNPIIILHIRNANYKDDEYARWELLIELDEREGTNANMALEYDPMGSSAPKSRLRRTFIHIPEELKAPLWKEIQPKINQTSRPPGVWEMVIGFPWARNLSERQAFRTALQNNPLASMFIKYWLDKGLRLWLTRRYTTAAIELLMGAHFDIDQGIVARGTVGPDNIDVFSHEFAHAVYGFVSPEVRNKIDDYFRERHPELNTLFEQHPLYKNSKADFATEGLAYYLQMALAGRKESRLEYGVVLTLNPEEDIAFFEQIGIISPELRDRLLHESVGPQQSTQTPSAQQQQPGKLQRLWRAIRNLFPVIALAVVFFSGLAKASASPFQTHLPPSSPSLTQNESESNAMDLLVEMGAAVATKDIASLMKAPKVNLDNFGKPANDSDAEILIQAQKLILKPEFERRLTRAIEVKLKESGKGFSSEETKAVAQESTEFLLAYILASGRYPDSRLGGSAAFVFDAAGIGPKSQDENKSEIQKFKIAVMASFIRYGASSQTTQKIFVTNQSTDHIVADALATLQRFYGPIKYSKEIREVASYSDIREEIAGAKVLVHPSKFNLAGAPNGLSVDFDNVFLLPLLKIRVDDLTRVLRQALIAA